jgi:hypothetical protein
LPDHQKMCAMGSRVDRIRMHDCTRLPPTHFSPAAKTASWPVKSASIVPAFAPRTRSAYLAPHDTWEIEVDVFEGDVGELVVGEVAFGCEAASDEFEPPD